MIERAATTEHTGRLQPLRRVVSPEPVLTPDVAALTGAVAERYAGTRSDVLRLAVPPRHATTEKQPPPSRRPPSCRARPGAGRRYDGGRPCSTRSARGESPAPSGRSLPGDDWADLLAEAVVATARPGAAPWSACPTTATSPGSTPR